VPSPGAPGAPSPTASPTPSATPGATPSPGATPGANPTAGLAAPAGAGGESSASRQWELGREVAVSNQTPGKIKRLSVAVALSASAMAKFKPADIEQIKSLVSAAVGADPTRGDTVAVVVRNFDVAPPPKVNFWEQPWFASVLHNGVALLGLILVLLIGVRPLIKALKRPPALPAPAAGTADAAALVPIDAMKHPVTGAIDAEALGRQVGIAQRLVAEKPDSAALALRQMLQPQTESGG